MVMEAVEGSFGAYGGGELAIWDGELFCDGFDVWRSALELCWRRALTREVMGAI